MNLDPKLEMLRAYSEIDLVKEVLLPLFAAMGFQCTRITHGAMEKGKDIVMRENDRFGNEIWYAVVAKKGDISGTAASTKSSNIFTVINQATQAWTEEFTHTLNGKPTKADRVIIATSGDITENARECCKGLLNISGLSRMILFMEGSTIVQYVDRHIPNFFGKPSEKAVEMSEKLRAFIEKLEKRFPGITRPEYYSDFLKALEYSAPERLNMEKRIIDVIMNILEPGTNQPLESVFDMLQEENMMKPGMAVCEACSEQYPKTVSPLQLHSILNKNLCPQCIALYDQL